MAETRITVLVVDDHPLFRDGLSRAVRDRPDLELVGDAADGREALDRLHELEPAVAVLDLALPAIGGLDVLDAVRREGLRTRVLILTASTDGALVFQALSAGAAGYLSKYVSRAEVCDAVVSISHGELVLEPALQPALLAAIQALGDEDGRPLLTPREREILRLTADGLSAPAIGERLYVSAATVKTHLGHLYEKLGVSDRAACVAEAMRRGLLQ